MSDYISITAKININIPILYTDEGEIGRGTADL